MMKIMSKIRNILIICDISIGKNNLKGYTGKCVRKDTAFHIFLEMWRKMLKILLIFTFLWNCGDKCLKILFIFTYL